MLVRARRVQQLTVFAPLYGSYMAHVIHSVHHTALACLFSGGRFFQGFTAK